MDAQGKARDLYDMAIEAGDFALKFTGDRESAMQLMMSKGISPALADMATRNDARERAELLKREAAASREMAANTAKLSGAMSEMENALTDSVLRINKNFGLFDGLGNAVSTMVPAVKALTDVILQIGKIFASVKNIAQAAFAPVLEKFKDLGESVDKKIKSGEDSGILKYFSSVGETGNTDYQYDADQVRKEAVKSSADEKTPDLREQIKDNLRKHEGLRLKAYDDGSGTWTIGYGHTKGVKPGMTITKEQAEEYLEQDVKKNVDPVLSQYADHSDKTKMLAADLAFNAGLSRVKKGTRFNKLAEAGEIDASDYRKLYTTAKGVFMQGLVNRRNAAYEAASRAQNNVKPRVQPVAQHDVKPRIQPVAQNVILQRVQPVTQNVVMPRVQPVAYSAAVTAQKTTPSVPSTASVTQNITVYAPSTEASEIVAEIRRQTPNIGALTSAIV
jgi:lysozyme